MLPFLQYLLHVLELRSHLTWLIWCRSSDPARRPRMKRRSEGRGGPVGGGRPSDSCEDVRIRPVRRAHLDQGVRGAEAGSALAAANVSLWGGLRESAMLDPSGQYPWAAVRRARCSILCSRSRIRGTGNPPGFSAGNNWKSQKLTPLLPNARAKGRVSGHRRPKCSE